MLVIEGAAFAAGLLIVGTGVFLMAMEAIRKIERPQ
jgi:hypothetical protein